jgi:hypothetical protein
MRRLGYDAELKQFPQAWRVNFRMRGDEHIAGSAWEETPQRAMQSAAWATITARAA